MGARSDPTARPHKPHLDEMGIATWHEFKPARPSSTSPLEGEVGAKRREGGDRKDAPRKPTLDEMGPGVESRCRRSRGASLEGGRSTMGRPGQHGGFKANKRKR